MALSSKPRRKGGSTPTILEGLMAVRVRDVLLVASDYDSYILEEDGQLTESLDVEFYQLKLSWAPRITTVSSAAAALELLEQRGFELVITMTRLPEQEVEEFGCAAKALRPGIPVVLLTDSPQVAARVKSIEDSKGIDQAFIWRGDVIIFLAIVKYIEDRANVEKDTELADVRSILVVENSVRFYSSYLPMLYSEVMKQTNRLMADGVNTRQRLIRMKARAKILLAETFEEGWELFEKYQRSMLGIITDARFSRDGELDPHAGLEFVRRVRDLDPEMPALVQSSDNEIRPLADELGAAFVNKRSSRLLDRLRQFLTESLGFGDFVFRLPTGEEVVRVTDLDEMPGVLKSVPTESIRYHGSSHHFSNWCMARSEFGLAALLRPQRVDEFSGEEELRTYLMSVFSKARTDARRGVVADFSRGRSANFAGFSRIGTGSLGGKGRGLGFMHSILSREQVELQFPEIKVVVPASTVLGAKVFDEFLDVNKLEAVALGDHDDETIGREFLKARLPESIRSDLESFLSHVNFPLAVRSSSLLEDSHDQPFAGIYRTYMLPNNQEDPAARLHALESAIKLVYASTFFENARAYLDGTPFRMEEEHMAVVLQKVIGRTHESVYYPDISGVAQSFNYYPVLEMNAEDGVAEIALGLGRTVVEGGTATRFSPARPGLLPQFSSTESSLKNAQRRFYALDLNAQEVEEGLSEDRNLVQLDLDAAERHGTLQAIGSVYSAENDAIYAGVSRQGVRLVTFSSMLAANRHRLAEVLRYLLEIAAEGMDSPVELEFAVDLEPEGGDVPEFNILQIRPTSKGRNCAVLEQIPELEDADDTGILCRSTNALGSGQIEGIRDIIFVRRDTFDRGQTPQIASEIHEINQELRRAGRHCLLIGPGRWGSADRWLGIPVQWSNISMARTIIETTLSEVPITPSEGTHFFQNLISFGIGYLHLYGDDPDGNDRENWLDYDWLNAQTPKREMKYVRWLSLESEVQVVVDGRSRRGCILKPQ